MASTQEEKSAKTYGGFKASIGKILKSRRLKPLWMLGGYCYVMFFICRVVLLLLSMPKIETVTAWELWQCFWVGLRFDSMVTGYLVLPLAIGLTIATVREFRRKWFRNMITWYIAVIIIYVFTIETVGIGYFLHYGQRINWILPYYLQNPHEVFGYIFGEYPYSWGYFIIWPIAFVLISRWLKRRLWTGSIVVLPGWKRPALAGVVICLCIMACRGGLGNRPVNTSRAYEDTSSQLLVEIAKNHSYTLFYGTKNLLDDANSEEPAMFGLMDSQQAEPIVKEMLYQKCDTQLNDETNILWRRTDTGKPQLDCNVVIIVMESMAGRYVGTLKYPGEESCTPNLDKLAGESIYFDRMYAVGSRTCRGMVGTLCGHPDLGWKTILSREFAIGNFLALPSIFKDRNYDTLFVYGGRPTFDNMGEFFEAAGVDEFIGEDEISEHVATQPTEPAHGSWGWSDEYIFESALKNFDRLTKKKKKFFSVILTVSNHPPFQVPSDRVPLLPETDIENRIINATRYADWALGDFFKKAAGKDWFKDTIFVLVADTGRAVSFDKNQMMDATNYRIPCLIYAPGRFQPQTIETVASQTDIAPTLLSLLGGSFEHCFLGRNVLQVPLGEGFALMREDERMAFVKDNRLAVLPPRREILMYDINGVTLSEHKKTPREEKNKLAIQMQALYEMARYMYEAGVYNDPQKRFLADPQTARKRKGFFDVKN